MVAGGAVKRRSWIVFAALLVLCAAPSMAADRTVGVIMSGNIGFYQEVHRAFVGALVKEGFDHRKVDTFLQMPSPDPLSWTNAARRLAVAEVNVLMTSLLKYAKKIMPFTRLAVVYNELEPDSARQADEQTQLESQYGFQTVR